MPTLPDNVEYGHVVFQSIEARGDGSDADALPDAVAATGTVKFTATVPYVLDKTATPPVTVVPKDVTCTLDSSGIMIDPQGQEGVWLVANDATIWHYTATVSLTGTTPRTFQFDVVAGGEVDLTNVSPVTGTSAPIVQGPAGQEGPEGPVGPSGGPIPAGGLPGQFPTPVDGGGFEWRTGGLKIDVVDNGVVGDGTTDDTTAMNAVLASGVALGASVFCNVPVKCTSSLLVDVGLDLELGPSANIIKGWNSGTVLFKNKSGVASADRARIHGPGKMSVTGSNIGQVIVLTGDRIKLEDFTIDNYNETAISLTGDHIRCTRLTVINPADVAGCGGIRFCGGNDFLASLCHVESGDDALQFVPVGDSTGQDITNSAYVECYAESSVGRAMVVGLNGVQGTPVGSETMTASITGFKFMAISGKADMAFMAQNLNSSGHIDDGAVTDCTIDCSASTATDATLTQQSTASGYIGNIRFRGYKVIDPYGTAFKIGGTGTNRGILLEDAELERGRVNTTSPVVVGAGSFTRIKGGRFDGKGGVATVIEFGTLSTPVDHVTVEDAHIIGIANAQYGINANDNVGTWHRFVAARNTFEEFSGQTTAHCIRVDTNVTGALVADNDFSLTTHATKLQLLATDPPIQRDNLT